MLRTSLALLCFLCIFAVSYGQFNASSRLSSEAWATERAVLKNDIRWTKTLWTASETPYEKLSETISKRYGNLADLRALEQRLEALLRLSKPTPLEAYERLSLALTWTRQKRPLGAGLLDDSLVCARKYGDFTSYSMVRLRFLVQARYFYGKALAPLGERLLKRNPQDFAVEKAQSILLSVEFPNDLSQVKRGLELAERVFQRDPEGVGALGGYAGGMYRMWRLEKTKSNATSALKLLNKYISHPGALSPIANSFKGYVKEIKAWQGQ